MQFDSRYRGRQEVTAADRAYAGSTFAEVRDAIFANSYYRTWGAAMEPPLPVYEVTLGRTIAGLFRRLGPSRLSSLFRLSGLFFTGAAARAIDARSDLRWGSDNRGFRRILHPNGVCLTGEWRIDAAPPGAAYTGYFAPGSRALIVGRYSVCCTETRRGHYRSLSLVGKLFPTTDPAHADRLRTASFITQEDLGGSRTSDISEAPLLNAPDTTPWRRGKGLPTLLLTGLVFMRTDREPTQRQLYEIAELGKPAGQQTSAPEFMRLTVDPPAHPAPGEDLDFRDEILGRIYDRGDAAPKRQLTFHIEVSDHGYTKGKLVQRRIITDWLRVGQIVFTEAVASYNGDFVLHFPHPRWRRDRNNPATAVRRP